jgi:hypothetical protein
MKYFSIENSVDRVHGSVDRAAPWSMVDRRHRDRPDLARELAERRHAAPKLTAVVWGGRGRWRGAHRVQNRATRWRGCAGGGEEWNMTSVLDVGRLGAWISRARWAKHCGENGQSGGTFYRAEEATEGRGDGVVRGTVDGASSTCRLWVTRRGGSHLMRGK